MANRNGHPKRIIDIQNVACKDDVLAELKYLGIEKGMVLYVDCFLSKKSNINGGYQTIIEALQEAVGYEGTIIAPSFSKSLIDPACDERYRFARDNYDAMRRNPAHAFHKKQAASDSMFANQWMRNDAVYRSNHPNYSCVAWGKYAKLFCDRHPLHFPLGKQSFLDKLIEMKGYVLMLGDGCHECEIFHYAASLAMHGAVKIVSAPILKPSGVEYVDYLDLAYEDLDMEEILAQMAEKSILKTSYLVNHPCRFFSAKAAMELALARYQK